MSKAIIRKAAPLFRSQAWWQNKFQEVSLDQFKGKIVCQLLNSLFREVCSSLLLAAWLHFRVPNWDLSIQRQSCWIWSPQHVAYRLLYWLTFCAHGVYQEGTKVRRARSHEPAHACRSYSLNLSRLRCSDWRWRRRGYCVQRYLHHRRQWYSTSHYCQWSPCW